MHRRNQNHLSVYPQPSPLNGYNPVVRPIAKWRPVAPGSAARASPTRRHICERRQGGTRQDTTQRMPDQRIWLWISGGANRGDKASNDPIEGFLECSVAKVAHAMAV